MTLTPSTVNSRPTGVVQTVTWTVAVDVGVGGGGVAVGDDVGVGAGVGVAAQSRNKIDTLFESVLAMARSCLPSPLKSTTATEMGLPTPQLVAAPKLPAPSLVVHRIGSSALRA
jgi:hypothetical protein